MVNWDNSPRAAASADWTHPASPVVNSVVMGNTPAAFKRSLEIIRQRLLAAPTQPKIVTINAWNEWPEGSCLEPMTQYRYGYLEAVKAVFGTYSTSTNKVTEELGLKASNLIPWAGASPTSAGPGSLPQNPHRSVRPTPP